MLAKTMNWIAALWLPALLAVGLPWACRVSNDEARQLLHEAEAALQASTLDRAERLAEEGFEDWEGQPESLWHWEFRRLLSEVLLRRRDLDRVESLLEPEVPPIKKLDNLRSEIALNRARLYLQDAKLDLTKAADALQQAEETAERLGDQVLLARIQLRKAYWFKQTADASSQDERSGFDASAEENFQEAIGRFKQLGKLHLEAASRGSLGFFLMERFRFAESITEFKGALEVAREAGDSQSISKTIGNMGWCYAYLGNFDKASQLLRQAENEAAAMGLSTDQQLWLGNQGVVFHWKKEFGKAISTFQQASEIARKRSETDWEASWLINLANALIRQKKWKAAQEYNQKALRLIQKFSPEDFNDFISLALLNSAEIAIGQKQYGEAEKALKSVLNTPSEDPAHHWEAQAALGRLYAKMGRNREAEQFFEAALRSFEAARASLSSRDVEIFITFQERRMDYLQAYVEFLMQTEQPERALRMAESSRAQVLVDEGLGRQLGKPVQASEFMQASKSLDAVLISYWIAPERSYGWVVSGNEIRHFELPGQATIEKKVKFYAQAVQEGNPLADGNLIGISLFDTLIGPVADMIKPGSRVVLIPSGILYGLNFETLIVSEPRPHYWIDDVTLVYTPSLSFLQPANPEKAVQDSYLLLAFSPSEKPLEHVEKEKRAIRNALARGGLTPRIFSQSDASSQAFEEFASQDPLLVHFAAHAVANPESPLNSYVALSDRLYARTIATTKLNARLVTVSACRSAGAQRFSGEGLVGLAWAFLYAGADNVIAGLWDVNDRSSFELMEDLYLNLAAWMHPADALRQAKLDMMARGGAYASPYHWAPFQIYTHSSPFQRLFEPEDNSQVFEANGN